MPSCGKTDATHVHQGTEEIRRVNAKRLSRRAQETGYSARCHVETLQT